MAATLAHLLVLLPLLIVTMGAGYSARSQNFIVTAATPELAVEICQVAEKCRRDLALEWLGRELPPWMIDGMPDLCPIEAMKVSPALGAGGVTSFSFRGGVPFGWQMSVTGSRERVLDSVIPHEVTHTIFATHFGRPLPRWADEGACTTVEHTSERTKQERFLIEFLTTDRGIAFNRMFAMKEYPRDILPLYSQGYSLARFLIQHGGKPKFVQYVGDGMQSGNWAMATQKHYGYRDLSVLQLTWLEWVRFGSPTLTPGGIDPNRLASATPPVPPVASTLPAGAVAMASNEELVKPPVKVFDIAEDYPKTMLSHPVSEGWAARMDDNRPKNTAAAPSRSTAVRRPDAGTKTSPPQGEVLMSWSRQQDQPWTNPETALARDEQVGRGAAAETALNDRRMYPMPARQLPADQFDAPTRNKGTLLR